MKTQTYVNQLDKVVGATIVLALLYLGREVLIPITLAIALSFLVTPLVRNLRRYGVGHTTSVAVIVIALSLGLSAIGLVVSSQLIHMGSSLPQYEETIRGKIETLDHITLGKISSIASQADHVFGDLKRSDKAAQSDAAAKTLQGLANNSNPVPVELIEPESNPAQLLKEIISSVWGPLETTGIVFIVLIFVLLEQEALRDRFIRLIGQHNLRATTVAVTDAVERLNRFFVSQFTVNFSVGVLIFAGLEIIGVPQALLWGGLAAILRFVPYVGVWIAAVCASILAAAISPGWSLAIITLLLFFSIEMIISQVVEPRLYGHATGLSPLSVVIAAIFWSWIWGPVGLILSTPITLCLVVAGHYIQPLNFLEILLGELPALSLPENFYQRALSGDNHEIITSAKRFLKRKSFGAYCDAVLMPALHLARADYLVSAITKAEQLKLSNAIVAVLTSLEEQKKWWQRSSQTSVLEGVAAGRHLRNQREKRFGKWQGPLDVPVGTVVLAIGLGSQVDEIATEILVRVLRNRSIDCRHLSLEDLETPPENGNPDLVSMICFVSTDPQAEQSLLESSAVAIVRRFTHAKVMALCLSSPFSENDFEIKSIPGANQTTYSFEGVLQSCLIKKMI